MNVIRKIIFLTTLCGVVSGLCAQNISISTTKTSLVLSAPVGEELKYKLLWPYSPAMAVWRFSWK